MHNIVKVFDTSVLLQPPKFVDVISRLAEMWDLYRILAGQRGQPLTEYDCTNQFLNCLTTPQYHAEARVMIRLLETI